MGISGNLMKEFASVRVHIKKIESLQGKTIAIDVSNELYRAATGMKLFAFTDENGDMTSHLLVLVQNAVKYIKAGIKLVYVFDPIRSGYQEKSATLEKRRRVKEKAMEKMQQAFETEIAAMPELIQTDIEIVEEEDDGTVAPVTTATADQSSFDLGDLDLSNLDLGDLDQSNLETNIKPVNGVEQANCVEPNNGVEHATGVGIDDLGAAVTSTAPSLSDLAGNTIADIGSRMQNPAFDTWHKAAFTPTSAMFNDVKFMLDRLNIPWIEIKHGYEAEQIASHLTKVGRADYVLSSDIDVFMFGARNVLRREPTTRNGRDGTVKQGPAGYFAYNLDQMLASKTITYDNLVTVGIALGTDFNLHIKGYGVKTAFKNLDKIKKNFLPEHERAYEIFTKSCGDAFTGDDPAVIWHNQDGSEIGPDQANLTEFSGWLLKRNFSQEKIDKMLSGLL